MTKLRTAALSLACAFSLAAFADSGSSKSDSTPIVVNAALSKAMVEKSLGPVLLGAGIVRVAAADFIAGSGTITFSEFPLNTANPTYPPAAYGGDANSPTVAFDGFFSGQALGVTATCPVGAVVTGCVVGAATSPLSLAAAAPDTSIVADSANPSSPVLSGSPRFNGPIAVLFSRDMAAVGLEGGFFDSAQSTSITAFDRNGANLGRVTNNGTGIEFLGLRTADGQERIAGLLFSLAGAEAAGFAIDNLRFARAGQVAGDPPRPISVPVNNAWGLGGLAFLMVAGLALVKLRRRS